MNRSPFEIFRRNQRQFMVVLTGLAMFSFVFLDAATSRSDRLPMSLGILTVALICAGGLWVIGSPRGKGGEWAMYGAIVGAVIAFFGFRAQTNAPVFVSNIKNFSRTEIQELQARRVLANRFLYAATKNQFMSFGGTNEEQIVMRAIHHAEAQKLGISVSNEAVVSFIKQATSEKLSRPDYEKILRDLHIGESELFAILREEMAIDLFEQMDAPPRQRFGNGTVQTPLALWKEFQMLQVRQSMDVVAVPVAQFVSQVPEPKDSELVAFFEKLKDKQPGQDGRPGFRQERKVKLAYVAAEFEAFEKLVGDITDDEVSTYYDKNKESYRVFDLPDSPADPKGPAFPDDDAPANALQPANVEAPAAPLENPPNVPGDKPEGNSPPAPDKPENGAACSADEDKPASDEKPSAEVKPADEKPSDKKPEADKPGESQPAATDSGLPPTPGTTLPDMKQPEPKYRVLDDTLKTEIRETIMKLRAFEKMGKAIEQATSEMGRLNDEYLNGNTPEEKTKLGEEITKKLKKYAEEHGLRYAETKTMTQAEMMNAVDEPLAMSMQPSPNPFQPGSSVPELAFDDDLLFWPRTSDAFVRDKRFAYWKIANIPSKVPEFKEVKEQVVEALKFETARPLAERRAKELADLVKAEKKPMTQVMEGQTVNNLPDGPTIIVQKTGRFTWLNVPRNIPMQFNQQMPEPQISVVNGVERPDNEFMKYVFNELSPGGIGVVPNQIRSAYYVVQVTERDGVPTGDDEENLALKALQQQFLNEGRTGFFNPAYMALARYPMMEILMERQKSLKARYGLEETVNRSSEPMEP